MIKTFYGGEVRYALIPVPGTAPLLVAQCQRDLGISKDTDYPSGSDYPEYLMCFARALSFLASQLQDPKLQL
jgi:hypothetical protein